VALDLNLCLNALHGGTGMAAKKRAGKRAEGDSTAGQIRTMLAEGKSAKEISEKLGTSTAYVYVVKSEMNKASGATKPRGKSAARAARSPRGPAASRASSLAELLSDPEQVQAARQLIEAQIKELEAQIASKKATLKILSAAGG
jgi:DNA-binding NarL/FixJ family response regulator